MVRNMGLEIQDKARARELDVREMTSSHKKYVCTDLRQKTDKGPKEVPELAETLPQNNTSP